MSLRKTLTIAGSDASGGAGLEADLKAFEAHGTYGLAAVTVIATMDPDNNWSHGVYTLPTDVLQAQLKTTFSTGVDALKTGMLSTEEVIQVSGEAIKASGVENVVIDPVMVCKGEDEVLNPGNVDAMIEYLLPLAKVTTPNLFEAGQLAGVKTPKSIEEMQVAAEKIHVLGAKNVVIKGGRGIDHEQAFDLFYDGSTHYLLETAKVDTNYNHGAGCTFAASVTANLAKGLTVKEAVLEAKEFVAAGIQHGWKLNQFVGPVLHAAKNIYGAPTVTIKELAPVSSN